jgi:predicted nucleotidyltransferase
LGAIATSISTAISSLLGCDRWLLLGAIALEKPGFCCQGMAHPESRKETRFLRMGDRYSKMKMLLNQDPLAMIMPAANSVQFGQYLPHIHQQKHRYQQQMCQRWQAGRRQADHAAALLKQQFGVTEVFLFGSLLQAASIHPESDIDLAVLGLSRDRYCEAVGTLLCAVQGFSVDLIMLETAQDSLLDCVMTQGVRL